MPNPNDYVEVFRDTATRMLKWRHVVNGKTVATSTKTFNSVADASTAAASSNKTIPKKAIMVAKGVK